MWLPHTTVASIVVRQNRFLMVQEESEGKMVFNQPAGHLEANESLIDACIRETLEETGWNVSPSFFLGISEYTAPQNGVTYIRHTFIADPVELNEQAEIDSDIIDTKWMTYEEIIQNKLNLRSPIVLNDIQRYLSGSKYPLDLITVF